MKSTRRQAAIGQRVAQILAAAGAVPCFSAIDPLLLAHASVSREHRAARCTSAVAGRPPQRQPPAAVRGHKTSLANRSVGESGWA